ncbi:unnamed protein product, partial [Rotaria sordida]
MDKKKSKTGAKVIHDNDDDDDIYPTVKVTHGGELSENATESGNKDNDNDVRVEKNKNMEIIEKQEQLSTLKSKHKRGRSDDKELLSPADEEENGPTSTPSPPPPTTAEKTKVKKSSPETITIVYTNTSVPLLLDIMTDDIHSTNQSESINSSSGCNIFFLNRTSFIIDHINIHVIDSMNAKLLNTTNANLISFPSISLFPHSPNYIHIYFLINAISFSQNLKTTSTYSIN